MKNWTIGKRITGISTLLIGLTLVVGIAAYVSLTAIRRNAAAIHDDYLPGVILAGASSANTPENFINVLLAGMAATPDESENYRKAIKEVSARHVEILAEYEKTIIDAEDRRLFNALNEKRSVYSKARQGYLDLIAKGDRAAAAGVLKADLLPSFRAYTAASATLVERNRKGGDAQANAIVANTHRTSTLIIAVSLSALVISIAVAFLIIRSLNRTLRNLSSTLGANSEQVAAAASQVSSASTTLASGASEQAASLEETSATLEEMSSMTKRNAENATKANGLTREARATADRGSADMQSMAQSMQDIKSSSDDIAKIIKTIDEIAFQTNILALNAAVEAARAGEAGAGFAVVADEVRALAQRSAQSAKETATKIETAIAKTTQGVELTRNVQASLREIVEKVRFVDELVAEVAQASNEQSEGISQVTTAVGQMDQVTQDNAATAEESASASEELSAQAACLKDAVGELLTLVGGASGAPAPASHPAAVQISSRKPVKPTKVAKPAPAGDQAAASAANWDQVPPAMGKNGRAHANGVDSFV